MSTEALLEAGKYVEARQEIDLALRYNRAHPAALNNLRVLADLEGRPAEMPALAAGRWTRVVAAWHRLWNGNGQESPKTNDSGSTVASR